MFDVRDEMKKQISDKSPGLTEREIYFLSCEIRMLNPYGSDFPEELFDLLKSLLGEKTNG